MRRADLCVPFKRCYLPASRNVATFASSPQPPAPRRQLEKFLLLGKFVRARRGARRGRSLICIPLIISSRLSAAEPEASGLTFDPGHGPPAPPPKPASRQGCSLKSFKSYIPRLIGRPPPFRKSSPTLRLKNRELGANQAFPF